MVCRIGQDLGTLDNHEVTKTTARVRVFIDGLKPLVKYSIVEFDTGEESPITLEYEKLENHCSYCYSLLHHKRNCPSKPREVTYMGQEETSLERPPTYRHSPQLTLEAPPRAERGSLQRPSFRETELSPAKAPSSRVAPTELPKPFQARVDRHGIPFGDRISTKQTRNPPPARQSTLMIKPPSPLFWREKPSRERAEERTSPPYSRNRTLTSRTHATNGGNLLPRTEGQWRQKPTTPANENTTEAQLQNAELPQEKQVKESSQIPTMAAVMEELQEATRQYLSCPDPVEAAARRQRAIQGDARGDMEETALSIIHAEKERQATPNYLAFVDSDPSTPATQGSSLPRMLFPDPAAFFYTPPVRGEDITGVDPLISAAPPPGQEPIQKETLEPTTRTISIIISPTQEADNSLQQDQNTPASQQEENLKEYQNKVKKKKKGEATNLDHLVLDPIFYVGPVQRSGSSPKSKAPLAVAKELTKASPKKIKWVHPMRLQEPPPLKEIHQSS